ncbi:MAG: hypothetical protein GY765_38080 [bacterium]|nr:hypothetical protein [bacterium]
MTIYRFGKLAVLVILLSFVLCCSKDEEKKQEKKFKQPETPELESVEISPPTPISTDSVLAVPVPVNKQIKFVKYSCQWYVNGDQIAGLNSKRLPAKYVKKGNEVFCRMQGARGILKSEEMDSEEVTIGNAPPTIQYRSIGNFNVPGEFRYKISASDPDGDAVTYKLLAPLDLGIVLDPQTGEIQWHIDELPTPQENENPVEMETKEGKAASAESPSQTDPDDKKMDTLLKIVFEVRDSNGAVSVSSITLDLVSGSEFAE